MPVNSSIVDILLDAAVDRLPLNATSDANPVQEIGGVLRNFIANSLQNNSLPIHREAVQRSLDNIALDRLNALGVENPNLLEMTFGGGMANSDSIGGFSPDELIGRMENTFRSPSGNLGSLDQIRTMLESGDVDPNTLQRLLREGRGRISQTGRSEENMDLETLLMQQDAARPVTPIDAPPAPMAQLDRIMMALEANNEQRLRGPQPAGRNVRGLTGFPTTNEPGRAARDDYIDMEFSDTSPLEGDPLTGDPLLEAITQLQAAGVPEQDIIDSLMLALEQADEMIQSADPARLSAGGVIDAPAILRDNQKAQDPNLILQALGLR